jgi:hypothetical protein
VRQAVTIAVLLAASAAQAQTATDTPAPLPPPAWLEAPARPARPRLSVAIGAGMCFDGSGFTPERVEAVPAMFATGGVGADWPVGVELAAFASTAVGRFHGAFDAPVDRLAIALVSVVRPLSWKVALDDTRYAARVLRAFAVEVGPGLERDATTTKAGSRYGIQTGVRFEIPFGRPGGGNELRLRLAARYMIGLYTPRIAMTDVGDSLETYGAIVSVF